MTMEPNILFCPFCGSTASINLLGVMKSVICDDNSDSDKSCGIGGPRRNTADAAIEAWNERHEEPSEIVAPA